MLIPEFIKVAATAFETKYDEKLMMVMIIVSAD